jgi:cyclophilin family peptidyl-prolyl cis-trans isomerase
LDSLDGKRVGFGRVIDGLRLMKIIDRVETDPFQRPKQPVKIENIAMWTPQPEEEEEEAKENEP